MGPNQKKIHECYFKINSTAYRHMRPINTLRRSSLNSSIFRTPLKSVLTATDRLSIKPAHSLGTSSFIYQTKN